MGGIIVKHPFIIDITDPKYWLYPTNGYDGDGNVMEEQRTLTMPEGIHKMFCFTDSLMHPSKNMKDDAVFMHEHHQGYETFFVENGGLDFFINGKKCFVGKGSIIHIQPYEVHGMKFRDYTVYRGSFHDWNCIDDSASTGLLEEHFPDAKKDPKLFSLLISNIDLHGRERADFTEVPASEVPAVRNPDRPMAEFKLEGVTMKMITARWENGGVNELWRAEMEPGFYAEWTSSRQRTSSITLSKGRSDSRFTTTSLSQDPTTWLRSRNMPRTALWLSVNPQCMISGEPRAGSRSCRTEPPS
jgi:hypothetical protein